MFRDSLPNGELDQTSSVSGVENVIISASPWCSCPCQEWRRVSGHKAQISTGLEGRGYVYCSLVWHCVTLYPSVGRCWTCKEGPASLPKLNIFLANTCCQKETFRKLAWDHTVWCTHGSLPVNEGSISCVFWSLNQGQDTTCAASPLAAADPLCQPALIPSFTTYVVVSPLCPMTGIQKPASESLSPRENCFNLIKWKWNLKWLNVYLLTGRNVV